MLKLRSFRTIALSVALATGSAACFGSFAATKTLHTWNGQITENKFVHTVMMWVFIIFPVYELFMFGDAIIFNVIEFWTGENPLASADDPTQERKVRLADVDLTKGSDGTVTIARAGREFAVRPVDPRTFEVLIDGMIVGNGKVGEDDGLVLFDANGEHLRTLFRHDLEDLNAYMESESILP